MSKKSWPSRSDATFTSDSQAQNNIDRESKPSLIAHMKTKLILFSCTALFSLMFAPTAVVAGESSADEQVIRDLDAQWSKAAGAKDFEKATSYCSDDAVVLPPNAPAVTTKETVRNLWKELLVGPGVAISWTATTVQVSKSGDMAYTRGTYEFTMNDPTGKPMNDRGKYVEVWKKQPDGKWKCTVDIWNSDLPTSPPSASEKK
jgi:ketosteroid isomerase-like protein